MRFREGVFATQIKLPLTNNNELLSNEQLNSACHFWWFH